MKTRILLSLFLVIMLGSCTSVKDFNYYQDVASGDVNPVREDGASITIKPDDRITVLVSSKNIELAMPFNLITINNIRNNASQLNNSALNTNSYSQYYTVSREGEINMPVLGKVKVSGLTRSQIEDKICELIIASENGFKDPTVTVDYANLYVKMLGEFNRPGTVSIDRDQFTLEDAIAKAGDLSVYGNRKNVKVYRVENGMDKVYEVDLTQRKQLLASPVYLLQQDDVVYVEPNRVRARQSTSSGNSLLQPAFWISTATLITSVLALILR